MKIDFHTYVGDSLLGYSLSPEQLLGDMARLGIDKAVACPVKGLDPYYIEPNRETARLQKTHPGVIHGYARVNPHLGKEAALVLEYALDELGLHGLVLHPWEETFAINDPIVFPLVELTASRGLPIMLETGYPLLSHPLQVADLAGRYPAATFIMTHGGQVDSSGLSMTDAEYVMHENPNIILETSGFFADEFLEKMPNELGHERFIWGSHSPWLNMDLEHKRIERLHVSDAVRDAIFGANALRLLSRNR